jgi:hypothetical protein
MSGLCMQGPVSLVILVAGFIYVGGDITAYLRAMYDMVGHVRSMLLMVSHVRVMHIMV